MTRWDIFETLIFCFQSVKNLDSLNDPVAFKIGEDDHENGSIIIFPKIEGKQFYLVDELA